MVGGCFSQEDDARNEHGARWNKHGGAVLPWQAAAPGLGAVGSAVSSPTLALARLGSPIKAGMMEAII